MLLKFRIETRKIKQPRIVVLRLSTKKGKPIEKSLGSFSAKRGYDHILKQLTPEELYEFENFVKTIEFAKSTFHCNADKLDRFIIKTAPEFKKALQTLWEKAKDYGIEFVPEQEMLLAAFNRAKIIEQQLAVLTDSECKVFEPLDIDITDVNPPKLNRTEDQKLLTAAVENADSLESLASLFNTIASQKYHKAPKFKAHHFEYLSQPVALSKKQPFPKWYYTIAIDALCQMGIKPDTLISPVLLIEHWLRLNKTGSLERTITAFYQQFKHLKNNPICMNVIKTSFVYDELHKMQQGNLPTPIPSMAIKLWLKRWKERHPQASVTEVIKSFNKEFPLLANNSFFLGIMEKTFD